MTLSSAEFKDCPILKNNQHYFGDSLGFFPDYWTPYNDLEIVLQWLPKDNTIRIN